MYFLGISAIHSDIFQAGAPATPPSTAEHRSRGGETTHRFALRTAGGPLMILRILASIHRLLRYGSNATLSLSSVALRSSDTLIALHSSDGMRDSRGYTSSGWDVSRLGVGISSEGPGGAKRVST